MKLGLALSGGGSRAAAFHRGTLRALFDLGIFSNEKINNGEIAVSSVSGGSVFGGAWAASIKDDQSHEEFLEKMETELGKGFIMRTIRPRLLKIFLPGYTLSHALAKTFDLVFFNGKKLEDLPNEPQISLNTSVLNNGQVGKFSQKGFRANQLTVAGKDVKLDKFPLSLAVMASAAFPVGMPPIYLKKNKHIPEKMIEEGIYKKHKTFALSDGGVLENLGVQTLLKSGKQFKSWDMIASDAGAPLKPWKPGTVLGWLMGFFMGLLSASVLTRMTMVMNDKQNRHMRFQLIEEVMDSWKVYGLLHREIAESEAMRNYLSSQPTGPRRKMIFVRIDQDWSGFFYAVPTFRYIELAQAYQERTGKEAPAFPPLPAWYESNEKIVAYTEKVVEILKQILPDEKKQSLEKAGAVYQRLGKEEGVERVRKVKTSFSALSAQVLDDLHDHAYWQLMASSAIYWD